jgi:hypothetical protein
MTLDVTTEFRDADKQLDSIEADLGIDQGWQVCQIRGRGRKQSGCGWPQPRPRNEWRTLTMLPAVVPLDAQISLSHR